MAASHVRYIGEIPIDTTPPPVSPAYTPRPAPKYSGATVYEIPLTSESQMFRISLAGKKYQLTLRWCEASESWILDIADDSGSMLLTGIPLVTGCDLLEQYGYLKFGGQLICQTDGDLDAVPTYSNLGAQSHLYWVVL